MLRAMVQADHVLSGGGDPGDQLAVGAAMDDAV